MFTITVTEQCIQVMMMVMMSEWDQFKAMISDEHLFLIIFVSNHCIDHYTTPFLTRTKGHNKNAERCSEWDQFKAIFSDENSLMIIFVSNHCIDHYTTPFLTRTKVYN